MHEAQRQSEGAYDWYRPASVLLSRKVAKSSEGMNYGVCLLFIRGPISLCSSNPSSKEFHWLMLLLSYLFL